MFRSIRPEVFLEKCVLKTWCRFKGEHPCQSAISIKMQNNFIETTLQHGSSPVTLLHIFRTAFFSEHPSTAASVSILKAGIQLN